jgi:uncharacterized membrane protein YkgB
VPSFADAIRRACANLYAAAVHFAARHSSTLLRGSLAIVMLWFAIPKFLPEASPVGGLVVNTVRTLSFGVLDGRTALIPLAVGETAIAVGLLVRRALPVTLAALVLHMAGTFTALLLFPGRMWNGPFLPTLEAEFILKNLVFLAAAVAVAADLHPATASCGGSPRREEADSSRRAVGSRIR